MRDLGICRIMAERKLKMLNKEKYAEEILEIACNGSALVVADNKPASCNEIPCDNCSFKLSKDCTKSFKEWANSEYIEPPVDWSKVPVDTPILVKDTEDDDWMNRYFAEYKNGTVYAWCSGATSWTENSKWDWKYAKLAESEE